MGFQSKALDGFHPIGIPNAESFSARREKDPVVRGIPLNNSGRPMIIRIVSFDGASNAPGSDVVDAEEAIETRRK